MVGKCSGRRFGGRRVQLKKLRSIHGEFYEWKKRWNHVFKLKKSIKHAAQNELLYIMTPVHGNVGDLAIAKATAEFLSKMDLKFIETTTEDLKKLNKLHSLGILNNRRILVHGGGYFGTIWPELDDLFMKIVKKIPDSKILCFPNTIYYENTPEGQARLKESAKIFNDHKNIKICAREKISYDMVCGLYNDVVLMPDMVLSMDESETEHARSGCLLCLRNDIEKTLDLKESNKYLDELKELFHGAVCITDTDSSDCIPIENRNAAINEKLDEFRSAELVVTDRLHGMIFSAITGTPCIVLNSKSHKIIGCYEWIKHLDYITLYKDKESIFDLYNQIPKQCNRYNNDYLQPYFSELKKYIMDMVS